MIGQRFSKGLEIRRGAFGVIYKGIYEKTGEQVAIKMDLTRPSTLKHETRILQYLFMEGVKKIPPIYWFGVHEENPCVVMPLFECSLYDYKNKGVNTFSLNKIMWLLLDIFENIHKKGVVHRDVKPQNFMIKNGELYLIDFGLATFYWNDLGEHRPDTGTTTMIGSPYFASLRIHEGHRYSRRDDLISLGYVIMYMNGFSWDISVINTNDKIEGSPMDITYPLNRHLQKQKEELINESQLSNPFITTSDSGLPVQFGCFRQTQRDGLNENWCRKYLEYVYSMEYDESPKYDPMKNLFI